jgi:hypothetical protein
VTIYISLIGRSMLAAGIECHHAALRYWQSRKVLAEEIVPEICMNLFYCRTENEKRAWPLLRKVR